ncbi:unnamed protein product [Medioppia subpectinata]|uniref:F-box domain-containing protein n=1 Tax=Medioppia subpectinata TaxID=1979941 RepID=A0A7R9KGL8_9ACAR|nr:unnamed protein product [Medioppia subpectinata]CAG2102979.1 unnamed protein product [Medioppia subpectinata]
MAEEMNHSMISMLTTEDANEYNKQKIYAKNSIDRFGDDLCQLLLSYFSLEDHIRCECLSKQFRRTVFVSLHHICIDYKLMRQLPESNIRQILATIAIKCTNVETIDCRGMRGKYEVYVPEVLTTFRDNCRNLREIYCNLWRNCEQTMHSFGPLVTRIGGIDNIADTQAITECHRLSHLRINFFRPLFDRLLAKNLDSFELNHYLCASDEQQLSAFLAENLGLRSARFMPVNTFRRYYRQLSRLTQLRQLRLTLCLTNSNLSYLTSGQNSLCESLRTIGLNCKQLQRLTLELNTDLFRGQLMDVFNRHSLDSLKIYRRLKRLTFTVKLDLKPEVLEPLTLCHRLTHLTINFKKINDNLFVNCDNHWPRLQYLSVNTNAITRECLSHISRLPALKTFCLQCHHSNGLTNNDFKDLLSRSPKLKQIEFFVNSNRLPFNLQLV